MDNPNVILRNVSGTALAALSGSPVGTELGLITRNIPNGTQAVSAVSLPLPAGAAQDATLTGGTQATKVVYSGNTLVLDAAGHPLVNLYDGSGNQVTVGQKAMATSLPVVIASNQTALSVTSTLAAPVWITGAVTQAGFPAGFNANITGTIPITATIVQTGFNANITGTVNIPAVATPTTAGGLSVYRVLSLATVNSASIKASTGQVYGWYITNTNAAARFVKLYDKSTIPTVGTDTPKMTLAVPGNAAGAGSNVDYSNGIAFAQGIGIGITAVVTDADTTAVAANEVVVNLLYK